MSELLELDSATLGRKISYRLDNINAADFKGRAIMPWLIMAANPHLSIKELLAVMEDHGYERTRSWISRRRWMIFGTREVGRPCNGDGQDGLAHRIMDQHRNVSARELARILRGNGIKRGKDWVLRNRVG